MAARRPTASAFDEAFALDDVYDEPATEAWDAEERSPEGPLTVCLSCGASPPVGSGCEHPLVAALERAPADIAAAAQRLAIAARAYHECERALRRLVTREQEAGRAELSSPPPRPLPFAKPQAPEASAPPCPRCGFPDAPPAPPRPQRRGAGKAVAQTLFAFADTPPQADETADAATSTDAIANATPPTDAAVQVDALTAGDMLADTALAPQMPARTQSTLPVDSAEFPPPFDALHSSPRLASPAGGPTDPDTQTNAPLRRQRTRRSKR